MNATTIAYSKATLGLLATLAYLTAGILLFQASAGVL